MIRIGLFMSVFLVMQEARAKDSIAHHQKLAAHEYIWLYMSPNKADQYGNDSLYLRFTDQHLNIQAEYSLSTINTMLKNENPISEISIRFVDRSHGFIYGFLTGYMFYPFLFRTEDGGKTWYNTKGLGTYPDEKFPVVGVPLRREHFMMFDKHAGFMATNWNNGGSFNYMLTNDGGRTWQKKSFKLSDPLTIVPNDNQHRTMYYSVEGKITVVIARQHESDQSKSSVIILRSDDFGHSFREMK